MKVLHNKKAYKVLKKIITGILPGLFWFFLIFAFDTPAIAILTLCAAAFHELFHIIALIAVNKQSGINGSYAGLRISVFGHMSYKEELAVSLAGPLSNILLGVILLLFFGTEEYLVIFGVVNLLTGASNLLPINSYDGHRILLCTLSLIFGCEKAFFITKWVSFFVLTLLCFFSLYVIGKLNAGYFIFLVFFTYFLKSI